MTASSPKENLGKNAPEYSVSEISGAMKRLIEGEFAHVRIKGEIGRVSRPASGHLYLDLKDDRAVLAGVVWKTIAARLTTPPEEGMEVVATGRLTTFAGQSKYQMIIEDIAPAGIGALMQMLEILKKKLTQEGIFDRDKKKALPYLPETIGVVTSPSGAVIRDILHRLSARFPRNVLVWPTLVQGERAAAEIAAAIKGFNEIAADAAFPKPDVLIVARGGGSLEDLWCFNDERVIRAVYDSEIPVISAVGHETDTTLIDYVADVRAPTPTAAAELAVPVRSDLLAGLAGLEARRLRAAERALARRRERLIDIARALPKPQEVFGLASQRFDLIAARLFAALKGHFTSQETRLMQRSAGLRPQILSRSLEEKGRRLEQTRAQLSSSFRRVFAQTREKLEAIDRLRETLSYKATLARGYSVIRDHEDAILTDLKSAQKHIAEVEFADGRLRVEPISTPAKSAEKKTRKMRKNEPNSDDQGFLF